MNVATIVVTMHLVRNAVFKNEFFHGIFVSLFRSVEMAFDLWTFSFRRFVPSSLTRHSWVRLGVMSQKFVFLLGYPACPLRALGCASTCPFLVNC